MSHLTYKKIVNQHLNILKSLQADSGLFLASRKGVDTGYDKSWLRDNFYECIAFEVIGDWDTVEKTYDALLEIFLKHEDKIDWAIANKPAEAYQYIHARFHPETFDEFWEEWGNRQNDAIGAILFRIGELETHRRGTVLENEDRIRITHKLIKYLQSIQYWHDPDSGMWEEDQELHASSVGACLAGLKAVEKLPDINVPNEIIIKGQEALDHLLPRESDKKFVDLALLSLIYPYNVANPFQRAKILENIEYHLLKDKGVVRYKGDMYYNKNEDRVSEEAEWTFGIAWLAIIYEQMGEKEKATKLVKKLIELDTPNGMPELYLSNSEEYNENTPLGWSESLFIVALHELNEKGINWNHLLAGIHQHA